MKTKYFFLIIFIKAVVSINSFGQTWSPVGGGMNNNVNALIVFNNELYAGGSFSLAGNNAVQKIAKFNGSSWESVGGGITDDVYSLEIYKDKLYAGGILFLAKWENNLWNYSEMIARDVYSIGVFNGNLYFKGLQIMHFNTFFTIFIINDTNSSYYTTGSIDGSVYDYIVYNNNLFIGGSFYSIGSNQFNHVAKWNTSWSSIGNGLNGSVYAFAIYNNELFAGGSFTTSGTDTVNYIAKWDGTDWKAVGTGMNGTVRALTVYNGELYAGGDFTMAGGTTANHIAKWNDTTWAAVGSGTDTSVYCMAVYNDELYVGGAFIVAGGDTAKYIAKWKSPNAIESQFANSCIVIAPNPVTTQLTFTLPENINQATYAMYNMQGKIQKTGSTNQKQTTIDVSAIQRGLYLLKIITNQEIYTKKVLIQ